MMGIPMLPMGWRLTVSCLVHPSYQPTRGRLALEMYGVFLVPFLGTTCSFDLPPADVDILDVAVISRHNELVKNHFQGIFWFDHGHDLVIH